MVKSLYEVLRIIAEDIFLSSKKKQVINLTYPINKVIIVVSKNLQRR